MKCRVTITLEGLGPFHRTFVAPGYREGLDRGREKARTLTRGAPGAFAYQLCYAAGGIDWQIMETGNQDDLMEP